MTIEQFCNHMAYLATVYEVQITEAKLAVYQDLFIDVDDLIMKQAIRKLSLERPYPTFPKPGEIQQAINSVIYVNELPESEAWGLVKKLIRKYGHNQKDKALSEMPELVRKTAEQMGWYDTCISTEPDEIIRAQFMRMYKCNQSRQHELNTMNPEFIKQLQAKKLFELEG
jgi:hypothetical protein